MNKLRISSTGSLAGKGVANSSQLQINSQTSPGSKPISIPPKPSSSSSTFGKDDYRTTEQKYGPTLLWSLNFLRLMSSLLLFRSLLLILLSLVS